MGNSVSIQTAPPAPIINTAPTPPVVPFTDGVSISKAQACKKDKCDLSITPGLSASTVKITRTFGSVSASKCDNAKNDAQAVQRGELSVNDFKNRLRSGIYYFTSGNQCLQISTSEEVLSKMKSPEDVYRFSYTVNNDVEIVRILPKSGSGSFSKETKITITPSLAFSMNFNGKDIPVKTMTLYHPCPIRIENVQYDAVLSLNDPSEASTSSEKMKYVVLIPLMKSNRATDSTKFFNKIAPQLSGLMEVDPVTNDYPTLDVPTDSDWSLTKLFGMPANDNTYKGGFFSWVSATDFKRVEKTRQEVVYSNIFGLQIPSGSRSITDITFEPVLPSYTYIILDDALEINASDLSVLRKLPVTPSSDAIHAMLNESLVYKKEACSTPEDTTKKENFENLESCDPFQQFPKKKQPLQIFITIIFSIMTILTFVIGVYLALYIVDKDYYKDLVVFVGKFVDMIVNQFKKLRSDEEREMAKVSPPENNLISGIGNLLGNTRFKGLI